MIEASTHANDIRQSSAGTVNGTAVSERVRRALAEPYRGYAYAYPHKTAYRPLAPPRRLENVWRDEPRSAVGIYVHIPFCEMRCGFCNLFTVANADEDRVCRFVSALERQVAMVSSEIGPVKAASLTIGGGTPTYLPARDLERIIAAVSNRLGVDLAVVPGLIETSPTTATPNRLDVLEDLGVSRISIGAQSFVERETRAMGRPQNAKDLVAALDRIRARSFRTLNIDLIYGSAEQTPSSLLRSLRQALKWLPEEIFMYPLYIRPLTGLAGRETTFDAHRRELYRAGRDYLQENGYVQLSMRMFRRSAASGAAGSVAGEAGDISGPVVGLGAGARSRTARLHYSSPYAVGRASALSIIDAYSDTEDFCLIQHGVELDAREQMRRTIILSCLSAFGLDLAWFEAQYASSPLSVLPELVPLIEHGMLEVRDQRLRPTAAGLEHADAIGPLLISTEMEARMAAYDHR